MVNTSWMLERNGGLMEANAHASEVFFIGIWNWWERAAGVYNDCSNQQICGELTCFLHFLGFCLSVVDVIWEQSHKSGNFSLSFKDLWAYFEHSVLNSTSTGL